MPEWKEEIRKRLASLKLAPAREAEIVEELSQHLDDCYAELLSGGATPTEAERLTLAEFVESELLAQGLRRVEREVAQEPIVLGANRRSNMIADFWQDLRYGARMLRKHPGFTTAVVLTLALGVGVNTALFSFIDIVLRPLPVKDPDTVVEINWRSRGGVSFADYIYLRDHTQVLSGLTASESLELALTSQGASEESQKIMGEYVSENFFSVIGAATALGRTFTPEENRTPGREPVVVLSYGLWQSRFGGDPQILGQTMRLNDTSYVIIGVMPREFVGFGINRTGLTHVWAPLMMRGKAGTQATNESDWFGPAGGQRLNLRLCGRLKPGRTREEARAEMTLLTGRLTHDPKSDRDLSVRVRFVGLTDEYDDVDWGGVGLVMLPSAMVLLIACANIANLLLARAATRRKEIGVRLCLGASRSRLIRQLLTESFLPACLGAAAGLLLSWWSLKVAVAAGALPHPPDVPLDTFALHLTPNLRVLSYTMLLSLGACLAFGLAPALSATRADLAAAIKDEGAATGRRGRLLGRSRLRNALVVAQVALCLLLLITTGLLLRGLNRVETNLGFDTDEVLVLDFSRKSSGDRQANSRQFYEELAARLEDLPGVKRVSRARGLPLAGSHGLMITLEGENATPAGRSLTGRGNTVTPNYFETVGIPIVRGRGFTEEEARAGARVVVVTEATARNLWPNQEPLGQALRTEENGPLAQVIGVARDAQTVQLSEIEPLFLYLPLDPHRESGDLRLLARTFGDAKEMQSRARAVAQSLNPSLFPRIYTLADLVAANREVSGARAASVLVAASGLLALLLAAVGLYGVLAYSVSQRTREIGIRMALGASRQDVLWLVIKQGLWLVGLGIALGVAGGAAVSRVLTALLFGLNPLDPIAYLSVSLFLAAVAMLATYLPAGRAASVSPMTALRHE